MEYYRQHYIITYTMQDVSVKKKYIYTYIRFFQGALSRARYYYYFLTEKKNMVHLTHREGFAGGGENEITHAHAHCIYINYIIRRI